MTAKIVIRDGQGRGHLTGVTSAGELVVTGVGDNQSKFVSMTAASPTVFNFFSPESGFNFFITSIIIGTPAGASTDIDIFEASSPTSSTIDKEIIGVSASAKSTIPIIFSIGGFLKITEGEFINATTTNATTKMTIIGYYRKIIQEE